MCGPPNTFAKELTKMFATCSFGVSYLASHFIRDSESLIFSTFYFDNSLATLISINLRIQHVHRTGVWVFWHMCKFSFTVPASFIATGFNKCVSSSFMTHSSTSAPHLACRGASEWDAVIRSCGTCESAPPATAAAS